MKLTLMAINKENQIIPPRTKKNHPQIIPNFKRPILLPSPEYLEWERAGLRTLLERKMLSREKNEKGKWVYSYNGDAINWPVNCKALIYREKLSGDAVGFYQAIGDFLEVAGIVTNDRLIVSWDGSRLEKDPKRPRIELELTPVGEPGLFGGAA